MDRTKLLETLVKYFNESELQDLCFDLNIDHQQLSGGGKHDKARELVLYCERHDRLEDLERACRKLRSNTFPPPSPTESSDLSERLKRYLPFKLYQELKLEPGPASGARCARHLTELLQTVQTYCSEPILQDAETLHKAQGKWCDATLLFADISGFTAMSERLNARGRAGAEEITRIVNEYFEVMVKILHENGGALLKFGGDALLGIFVGAARETARYAVQAAMDMQRAMIEFADIDTMVGRFQLKMKVGVHTGRLFTAHVGSGAQMEYWMTGQDVNITAFAEEAAQEGQVIVSQTTREYLTAWGGNLTPFLIMLDTRLSFYVLPFTTGYAKLTPRPVVRDYALPQDLPGLAQALEILSPYLPEGLLPRLVYNPRHRRIEGEHRLVAVLFVNVLGLSDLMVALGPGQADLVTQTMQDYFTTMQAVIARHGGVINKTDLCSIGDKLLVVFGAPVAHEDDVDQAAHAAIALHKALEQVNQRLVARCPAVSVRLRQRIGLSTGSVFSGNVGATVRQEYTIMGDEVNLAARLMSSVPWDETWVSSHVFIWLKAFGDFEPVGEISVKGKQTQVSVYRLKQMSNIFRPRPPLINQESENQRLEARWNKLLQGEGGIVSITGEPGIGKSRLWEELRDKTRSESALWLTGHCRSQQGAYQLWAELLRDYLKLTAEDEPETQLKVLVSNIEALFGPDQVNDMCPFLANVMGLPPLDKWEERVRVLGEHLPERLAQEVCGLLERLTEDRAVVLVCENLQWADSNSVDILLAVIELVRVVPILLGFTVRPGQYPEYSRVLGKAAGFGQWFESIQLGPLDSVHSRELAQAVLGSSATPELIERIWTRSRGTPLFIREIAQAAIAAPDVLIPETIQMVIESRVDALEPAVQRAIKAAAVIGTQFTLPEWTYMLGEPDRQVRQYLADLRCLNLVDDKKIYYELHPLVQEVVYNGQTIPIQRGFHRQLGQYWAGQSNAVKAAEHYSAGELWDQALSQGEQAARQSHEGYLYLEAIRLCNLALNAADKSRDNEAQARLCHRLGQVYFQLGDYERSAQAHRRELGYMNIGSAEPSAVAGACCALGRTYDRWGKFGEALDELERGLKLVSSGHNLTRAELLLVRCSVLTNMGRLADAERDGREALQIAQALGARHEEAFAFNNLGAVYGTQQRFQEALEHHQRSLVIRRELGLTYEVSHSLANVGTALGGLQQFGEAANYYREALAVQASIKDRFGEGMTLHNLAWLYWDQGQTEKAEEEFLHELSIWKLVQHQLGIAYVHNDLGTLCLGIGRLEEARDHLEEAARLYEAMEASTFLPDNYSDLAKVHLRLGNKPAMLAAAQTAWQWAGKNQVAEESRAQVIVLIDGSLQDFDPSAQAHLIVGLASLIGIGLYRIRILSITPGSVSVTLEMPEEAAQRLVSMYLSEEPMMQALRIKRVELHFQRSGGVGL